MGYTVSEFLVVFALFVFLTLARSKQLFIHRCVIDTNFKKPACILS